MQLWCVTGQNYVTAVGGNVFSAVVYGAADREFYANPVSLKLDSTQCQVTTQVKGDGVDNDCDQSIDEEICNGIGNIFILIRCLFVCES